MKIEEQEYEEKRNRVLRRLAPSVAHFSLLLSEQTASVV
jgi:hypothetical protein